jgi:hypothetical protein
MLGVALGRDRLGYVLVIVLNDKALKYKCHSFGLNWPSNKETVYCEEEHCEREVDQANARLG